MSSNRLIYDTCAYKKELDQSTGPLSYTLNPIKYENCSKCRMELGIVGVNVTEEPITDENLFAVDGNMPGTGAFIEPGIVDPGASWFPQYAFTLVQ